jgi:hypothetical protein
VEAEKGESAAPLLAVYSPSGGADIGEISLFVAEVVAFINREKPPWLVMPRFYTYEWQISW